MPADRTLSVEGGQAVNRAMPHVTLRIETMQTLDPITWFEIPAQDLERAMQF